MNLAVSAFAPKADIFSAEIDVCYVPIADVCGELSEGRSYGKLST